MSTFSAILTLFVASNRPGSLTTTANASSVLISSPTACASSDRRLALCGGKQKKLEKSAPTYTNSYIIGVSLEAGPKLLSLMFTYDPTFDPNGPRAQEVQSWCNANNIRRDQIFYEKSVKKYCKESKDQVIEFARRNRAALNGARVIHDQGGTFKLEGNFILAERADRIVALPAEQHGKLSVLDNKLNAVAKQKWRSHRHNGDRGMVFSS